MSDFKITMAAARVNAGMTQTEAAEKLGISRATLIAWEAKDHKLKNKEIMAAAALYHCPVEFFLQKSVD